MAKDKKKILLIVGDPQLVELIQYPLEDEGYTVIIATDGPEGLKKAVKTQPDLVLVDFKLRTMKGNTVAQRLRRDPVTEDILIIMLADESQLADLDIGPRSSVDDFLIRPFSSVELLTKVNPLLASREETSALISTGNSELDGKMGGGIPVRSLTLIEGDSGAGKSVLSQQMMRGCLDDGFKLSLFTSENTVKSLVRQMRSLNLDITDYLLLDNIRIFPIETSSLGKEGPPTLMRAMQNERGRDAIFVDSITTTIPLCSDIEVLAFFERAKRICSNGITVIIVVHSHGLNRELLIRIRSLCDAHFQLRTEEVGNKLVKTLEVTKVRGAEQSTGNIVSFEIEPGWGMRIIPIGKVRG
jgi:flagellar protein FlaH